MRLKNVYSWGEGSVFLETEGFVPKKLLNEVMKFRERNALAILAYRLKDKKPVHYCCPRCLKAYLIKKTRELKLGEEAERMLNKMLKCETGHEGYFIDGNHLIKIDF